MIWIWEELDSSTWIFKICLLNKYTIGIGLEQKKKTRSDRNSVDNFIQSQLIGLRMFIEYYSIKRLDSCHIRCQPAMQTNLTKFIKINSFFTYLIAQLVQNGGNSCNPVAVFLVCVHQVYVYVILHEEWITTHKVSPS